MKRALGVLLGIACLTTSALAGPRWTLDLKPVKVGTVTTRGLEGPGTYLFMVFELKNAGNDDAPVRLGIDVRTDVEGRAYRAGFDPIVKKAVERRLGRKLKSLNEARGTLGSDATVECVATFGKVDPNVDTFKLDVLGLSDRVYSDKYKTWVEDRILTLTYLRRGDELYRQHDLLSFQKKEWRLRVPRQELRRK
jgi:hypothetical protein